MRFTLCRTLIHTLVYSTLASAAFSHPASAQNFNWKKHQGATITFLANNNPVSAALLKHKADFEALTGITLKVDTYQEQQMRQRLYTVMNARSDEVDVFMSMPFHDGRQFSRAGWYADLKPLIDTDSHPDWNFADFSPSLVQAATWNGLLAGLPLNIEGPVLYWRKDIFARCGVELPATLTELEVVAARLKACDPAITPFVSRGLKPALTFTYSVFLHNMGGDYMADGKSQLCSPAGQASLARYARMLKDYGPPGVVNYTFYQISTLYREGRAAMAFESSNELRSVMEGGARLKDTGIAVPPGDVGGSRPTVIGWTMAVSAHSKKQGAAWYFVQWATSQAIQEKMALDGIAPPRASVANGPAYRAWMDAETVRQEWVAAVNELGQTGTSDVAYPIVAVPASREWVGQAVNELILGQKTVGQACAEADRQLDMLIAKDGS